MNKNTAPTNPQNMAAAGRVIEWNGDRPIRIQLATGLALRLSEASGLYLPEG